MSREDEHYRDNLAELLEYFEGKRLLTTAEVARYCGIEYRTAAARFGITREGIMLPTLARKMCKLTKETKG